MERLGGLDAGFLALETPTMRMHVAAVMVFDGPVSMSRPADFYERVRQTLVERIHLVPPLRRRAVRVPLGLDHPV
jgi:diacylglycerol O-acyltransferase / wax synthase